MQLSSPHFQTTMTSQKSKASVPPLDRREPVLQLRAPHHRRPNLNLNHNNSQHHHCRRHSNNHNRRTSPTAAGKSQKSCRSSTQTTLSVTATQELVPLAPHR